MRRKSTHMDNMAKFRADGGPTAMRMLRLEKRIEDLEKAVYGKTGIKEEVGVPNA